MNKLSQSMSMTESTVAFEAEHARTHRRWASAVLALYGSIIVLIGIGATLVHRSSIMDSTPPAAMQLQAKATIR